MVSLGKVMAYGPRIGSFGETLQANSRKSYPSTCSISYPVPTTQKADQKVQLVTCCVTAAASINLALTPRRKYRSKS